MVGRLLEDARHARRLAGVPCGVSDDFLEQFGRHGARAGERQQRSAWIQQLERQEVEIFVAAAALFQLGLCLDEFRRIQNNQIKGFARVAACAKILEDIRLFIGENAPIQLVGFHVLACHFQGVFRRIDLCDGCRAKTGRAETEAARVAEAVEDGFAVEVDREGAAVFALVQIVACLVAVGDVHP